MQELLKSQEKINIKPYRKYTQHSVFNTFGRVTPPIAVNTIFIQTKIAFHTISTRVFAEYRIEFTFNEMKIMFNFFIAPLDIPFTR